MTEKQIETQILSWLNLQKDTVAWKFNSVGIFDPVQKVFRKTQNRFIAKGCADILGIHKGRFFAIEVKTPASLKATLKLIQGPYKLNDKACVRAYQQKAFIDLVNQRGCDATFADSIDSVIEWFKGCFNAPR